MLLPMLVEPDRVAVPEPEAPAVDSPSPLRVEPLLDDGAAPPPAPAVYEAGQAELIPPRALPGRREPDYPPTARRLRAEGTVVLRAVITVEGAVDEVEVVRAPEPDWGMVEAAMAAVAAWRYEPGMLRGRPVAVRMTVMVEFELH
jgi:protein TonB